MPANMTIDLNMTAINVDAHVIANTNADGKSFLAPVTGSQNENAPVSFADIMKAVFGGLEKGIDGLKSALTVNAAGKAVTIDELMQRLFGGGGIKTGDGETITGDAFQQMMLQMQTAGFVQPVMPVIINQAGDAAPDIKFDFKVNGSNNNTVIGLTEKSGGELQKIRIHSNDASFTQMKVMTKSDGLQAEAMPSPGSGIVEPETAPAISMTAANKEADNKNISMLVKNMPSTTQQDQNIKYGINDGAAKAAAGSGDAIRTKDDSALAYRNILAANDNSIKLSPGQDKAAAAQFNAVLNAGTDNIESKNSSSVVQAAAISGRKPVPKDADNSALASTAQLQQTPYGKDEIKAKETVHISRLNELSEPIMKTLGAGDKHVIIKIEPPELGSVQIKLRMENGVLKVDFRVDSPAVKELFSMAMPHIKSSIEDSGIKAGDFFVDVKDQQHPDGRGRHDDAHGQQNKQQKKSGSNFYDFFA